MCPINCIKCTILSHYFVKSPLFLPKQIKKRNFSRFTEGMIFMALSKLTNSIKAYTLKTTGETRYMFQIRTGPHSTTRRRGFLTVPLAEIAYSNLRNDIILGKYNKEAGILTYQEIYDQWLSRYKNTVKKTTYSKTVEMFKLHIIPYFGKTRIKDITVSQCQDALNHWIATIADFKKPYNYADKIFKDAIRLDYIDKDPLEKLVLPKKTNLMEKNKKNHNEHNFYTLDEQEQFLTYAKNHSGLKKYAVFRLLCYSGLRREEILALQWKDLNKQHLMINKALVYTPDDGQFIQSTKNEDVRDLILDRDTLEVLDQWKQLQHSKVNVIDQDKQLIFQNQQNTYYSLSRPGKWQQKINDKINLKHHVSIHGFRHTHGTLLLDNNPDLTPKDLQKRLGHRDLATTMNIYLHATDKSDDKILKALNNLDQKQKDDESRDDMNE